jgi:hypothetical protein
METASERWRRIEEIFTTVMELPLEQRSTYLEFVCGGDAGLRNEIEALLARDTGEGSALAGIIEGTAASLLEDDAMADGMVGALIGNYKIIRELGRGGMGAVYLAVRADSAFDKQVAIKLVKRGVDTDAVLHRFWYERRILAGSSDPSDTRAAYDVGMILTHIGAAHHGAGDFKASNEALDRAIGVFEPMISASPRNTDYMKGATIAYDYRGRNTWMLGNPVGAMAWYRKALVLADRLIAASPNDPTSRSEEISTKGPLGVLMALSGDRTGAVKMVDESLKATETLKPINKARAWWWYGRAYEALHDFPTAADGFHESLDNWKLVPEAMSTIPYKDQILEIETHLAQCRKHVKARYNP